MTLIAHRGCAARGPENTLAAIERALPHVDGVEVDVRRCGSGELVVVHDAHLGRLTGVDRAVSDTPLTELDRLSVLDSGESIPTLAAVCDLVPDSHLLNVELKTTGVGEDVETLLRDRPNVLVSSFVPDALAETTLPRALLFADDWTANLRRATRLDCVAVHPQYELVLDDPSRVDAAHDAGFAVNVWTPPSRLAPRLRGLGVDGVIVDDWERSCSEEQ